MTIMHRPAAAAALDIAQEVRHAAEISCPLARAARISAIAHQRGNLPRPLADLRQRALVEARRTGYTVKTIATELRLSSGRISQLTAAAVKEVAGC